MTNICKIFLCRKFVKIAVIKNGSCSTRQTLFLKPIFVQTFDSCFIKKLASFGSKSMLIQGMSYFSSSHACLFAPANNGTYFMPFVIACNIFSNFFQT